MVFVKNHLASKVKLKKSANNFVWSEINKEMMGIRKIVCIYVEYIFLR